jgi:hypothetical protein
MGRPRKIDTDAGADPAKAAVPHVSVLARRLADPESVQAPTTFIPLKDDPDGRVWAERWGNFAQPGRYSELIQRKGWVQVRREELASFEAVSDLTDKGDGFVWRGDKGRECLLKMPRKDYDAIKRREAQILEGKMHSMAHLKGRIAEAGAKQFGDQAGDELLKLRGDIRELPPERYSAEDLQELQRSPSVEEA